MKVLIFGYYGFKNLGDELILCKIIEDIKSIDSKAEIAVCSGDISYTQRIHDVIGVDRFSPESLRDATENSDIVVVGGGGLIQEYNNIKLTDFFKSFGSGIASYSSLPLIGKIFQKPVFYWSHGIGPIFTEEGRNFTKWFYSLADFITLRDTDSYNILKKIYPEAKNVYVDTDPVMCLDINRFIKPISVELPKANKIKIGLNIRPWLDIEGTIEKLSGAIKDLSKENMSFVIIPIPFDLLLDKEPLKKFITYLPTESVFEYRFEELDMPEEVISLMNELDFFVGMRLHSIMISRLLKIPTLSISYDLKTDKFSNIMKIPVIRIQELTKDNMLAQIRSLLNINKKNLKNLECQYKTPELFKHFIEGKNLSGITEDEVKMDRSERTIDISKNDLLIDEIYLKSLRAELDQKITEKDIIWSQLNQTIAEKDNIRNQLNQTITEKDNIWNQLNQTITEKDNIRNQLNQTITEKDNIWNQLNGIYSSDFWKVAKFYYRVRDKNPILRFIYLTAKKIKSKIWYKNPSKLQNHTKQHGVKEALKRVLHKNINNHYVTESKPNRFKEIEQDIDRRFIDKEKYDAEIQLANIIDSHKQVKGVILYKSFLDWNFPLFQRPHQLSVAFAKNGFLLLYYSPNYKYDNYTGFNEIMDNLFVFHENLEIFNYIDNYIVFLNWNAFDDLAPFKKPTAIIYDYLDHIELLDIYNEKVLQDHVRTIKIADIVTVTAENLFHEVRQYRNDVILCHNATDVEHFRNGKREVPEDIRKLVEERKPIIGYYGALARWFDYELLVYCASHRPNYNFLLIGYDYDTSFSESGLHHENIFRVGPVHYNALPDYLHYFDVATIPFVVNGVTAATSPVKLFEYAAGRKPIISTDLPECRKYKAVMVSHSFEEFLNNIDKALKLKDEPDYLRELDKLAEDNTWNSRIKLITDEIEKKGLSRPREAIQCKKGSYDIISFPIMPWDSRIQRSQQLIRQFAKNGLTIFRINSNFSSNIYSLMKLDANIFQLTLDKGIKLNIYTNVIDDMNLLRMISSFDIFFRNEFIPAPPVCVVELPFWYSIVEYLKKRYGCKIIYDCMDEHSGFSTNSEKMLELENRLAKISDIVIVSSKKLFDKMEKLSTQAIIINNATDFDHFHRIEENDLLKDYKKPIIGYFGAISDWFDIESIEFAARKRTDWTFILIGSTFGADISQAIKLPNICFLGEKPYSELPQYLYWFDVCLIPRNINKLTEAMNPVKFFEYISSGKPVVSAKLLELEQYKDILYFYETKEDFILKIETALEEKDSDLIKKRIDFARQNTWEKRFMEFDQVIRNIFPKVSIIIITYNCLDFTKLCINSIYKNSKYPNFEIIIVDNYSTDSTVEYLKHLSSGNDNVKVIFNEKNYGFAYANNQGIRQIDGEYVIFLNNDTVVSPGWIYRLIRHLENEKVGMVGPVTNSSGNKAQITVSYNVKTLQGFDKFTETYLRNHQEPEFFEIKMLGLYCVAMRKEVLDEVGVLDERFSIGTFEDDDFANRVRLRGYRIICARDVFIHHFGSATFSKLATEEFRSIYNKNKLKFQEKWDCHWEPDLD